MTSIPSDWETVWISICCGSHKRLFVPSKTLNLSDFMWLSRSWRVSHSSIKLKTFWSSMSRKTWQLRQPLSFSVGSIIERSVCITSVRFSISTFIVIPTMITRILLSAKTRHTRWYRLGVFPPRPLSKKFKLSVILPSHFVPGRLSST